MKTKCSICNGNIDTADPPGDKPIEFDNIIACENCVSEAKYKVLIRELKEMADPPDDPEYKMGFWERFWDRFGSGYGSGGG